MISGLGNYKKTLAIIGITAILLPSVFIFSTEKAGATVPVKIMGIADTKDSAVVKNTSSTVSGLSSIWGTLKSLYSTADKTLNSVTSLEKKEYWYDTILYAIVKTLLHQLTQSVIEWIRGGFEGKPLFIQDFGKYLVDAADQASGAFMKKVLSPEVYNAICTPFGLQIQLALRRRSNLADRMQCTLRTVIGNFTTAQDFADGLRGANSNAAWFAIALNPQNEPLGALSIASQQFALARLAGVETSKTESIFNQGFLSVKKCTEYWPLDPYEIDQGITTPTCKTYITTSPGKWVGSTLSDATGSIFRELELADEIDELITTLLSALLTWALSGDAGDEGIAGATLPEVAPVACAPRLFSEVNASLGEEAAYRDTLNKAALALNQAKTNYEGAKKCFFNSGLNEGDPQIAQINAEIASILEKIAYFQKDFGDAIDIIAQMESIKSRWPSPMDCQAGLDALLAEYYALKERLHSIIAAENDLYWALAKKAESERMYLLACNQPPPPVSTTGIRANGFSNQITISYKDAATITWCGAPATPCAGATSCAVSPVGWNGTSGTYTTGALTSTMTYTLNCQGTPAIIDSVTVNVESPW